MTDVLDNGIKLPARGSRDWYTEASDNAHLIDEHLGDDDRHLTNDDRTAIESISGKATPQDILDAIALLVDNAPETLNTLGKIATELGKKTNTSDLSTVATSGSYNDLSNKPTIPTKVSELANDSGFVSDVSNKADKSTTLSGYGITDAYTKTQVDSSLGGKANDSDVVHKSGDETIRGIKTINDTMVFNDIVKHKKDIYFFNNGSEISNIIKEGVTGNVFTAQINSTGEWIFNNISRHFGIITNSINNINPGALSLPDGNTAIYVTPSYTVGDTITMPYTGFLRIVTDSNVNYALVITTTAGVNETLFDARRSALTLIPVVKGEVLKVDVCTVTSGVYMRLLPSLGNVGE